MMTQPDTTPEKPTTSTPVAEVVRLDIDGPAHGGAAVARFGADAGERAGQVVFVRGALPGETGVPVRLDEPGPSGGARRYLSGEVAGAAQIARPSPHRRDPVCAAAAAGAGCCDLDYIDAAGSLDWKRQVAVDQFTRIGRVDLAGVPVSAESLAPFAGYRTRVRLGVDEHGQPGLRRKGSRGIVPLSHAICAQWSPALAGGLAGELATMELTPGAEICVAVGDDGVRSAVELVKQPRGRKTTRGRRDNRRRNGAPRRATQRRVLTGSGTVTHTLNGVRWELPVESFWQGHQDAPETYSRWITESLAPQGSEAGAVADGQDHPQPVSAERASHAWDLYGGAGVFAAALSTVLPEVQVDCVDVASDATDAGRQALSGREVTFVAGDVAAHLTELRGKGGTLSAVVLDPPRTGAGERVLEEVASRRPANILHIGCDPATAARDARTLGQAGYRLASLKIVDAFGLTHHLETLAHYVPVDAGIDH